MAKNWSFHESSAMYTSPTITYYYSASHWTLWTWTKHYIVTTWCLCFCAINFCFVFLHPSTWYFLLFIQEYSRLFRMPLLLLECIISECIKMRAEDRLSFLVYYMKYFMQKNTSKYCTFHPIVLIHGTWYNKEHNSAVTLTNTLLQYHTIY